MMILRFLIGSVTTLAVTAQLGYGFCFPADTNSSPSNLYVTQALTNAIGVPGGSIRLPTTTLVAEQDKQNHSDQCESLDTTKDLILDRIDFLSGRGRLGLRVEILADPTTTTNGSVDWRFRGSLLANDQLILQQETKTGKVLDQITYVFSDNFNSIDVGKAIILVIDTKNPEYEGNEVVIKIITGNSKVLGSKRVRWKCDCEKCDKTTGASEPDVGSIDYSMPVATVNGGNDSIAFSYFSEQVSNQGTAKLSLQGNAQAAGVSVVRDTSNRLVSATVGSFIARVIESPVATDPNRFIVKVSYDVLNPDSSVFREVVFENRTVDGAPVLKIIETLYGKMTETIFQKPDAMTWQMITGNGLKKIVETTDTTTVLGHETKRRMISEKNGVTGLDEVISDLQTKRKLFPWGYEVVQSVDDPSGLALTTNYDYFETGENTGSGSISSAIGLGRLQQVSRPDGSVEKYYYYEAIGDPRYQTVQEVLIPFAGGADRKQKKMSLGIDPIDSLPYELNETRVDGILIGRNEVVRQLPSSSTSAGVNSRSTTKRYTSPSQFLTSRYERVGPARTQTQEDGIRTYTQDVANGNFLNHDTFTGLLTFLPTGVLSANSTTSDQVFSKEVRNERGYTISTMNYEQKLGVLVSLGDSLVTQTDLYGRPTEISYFPKASGGYTYTLQKEYACCGLICDRDRYGIDTFYAYDDLRRVIKMNRLGVTTETVYQGRTMSTHRYPETVVGSLTTTSLATTINEITRTVRNGVGDVIEEWQRTAANGSLVKTSTVTTYAPSALLSKRVVTTFPATADDNGTPATGTVEHFLDGQMYQTTGNMSPSMRYSYSVNATGILTDTSYLDGAVLRETMSTQQNWAEQVIKTIYSSDANGDSLNDFSTQTYNFLGQLISSVDPDGVVTLHAYNARGEKIITATDLNGNGTIDTGTDRVMKSETAAVYNGVTGRQTFVRRTLASRWLDSGATPTEVTEAQSDLSIDGLRRWSGSYPGRLGTSSLGAETVSVTTLGTAGQWTVTTTSPDGTYAVESHSNGRMITQAYYGKDSVLLYTLSYGYADPLYRLKTINDSRSGTTTQNYVNDQVDVLSSITDPLGRVIFYSYDSRNRQVTLDLSDTLDANGVNIPNLTTTTYYVDSTVKEVNGDQNYRRSSTYDHAQRPITLTTYGSQPAITRWEYDTARGWLNRKRYNSSAPGVGLGPTYSYTPAGRLKTVTSARSIITSYSYAPATGDLAAVSHSDGTVGYSITSRDRAGRVTAMVDVAGSHTLVQSLTGQVTSETLASGGLLGGLKWNYAKDTLDRTTQDKLTNQTTVLNQTDLEYDASGRMSKVSRDGLSARYLYHPSKYVLAQTSIFNTTGAILHHTRSLDAMNRLTAITSHTTALSGGLRPALTNRYTLNALDQRTATKELDGQEWSYGYNSKGEVTSAGKKTANGSAFLAGQSFRYAFDGIGNRTSAETGGDVVGLNRRTKSYTPNALNQFNSITHHGYFHLLGKAPLAASVTVNGVAALRQGTEFSREVSFANTAAPRWESLLTSDGSTFITTEAFIPLATTSPSYDNDGNLTADGQFLYTWDALNRLTLVRRSPAALTAGAPFAKVSYQYDAAGRMFLRQVFANETTTTPSRSTYYLYRGWNCYAECESLSAIPTLGSAALTRSHVWGLDLSSTMEGAGGVGGLVWTKNQGTGANHLVCQDGNGNVRKLINSSTFAISASYDYGPFGELLRASGPEAKANRYRFSTKPQDPVTGLLYYTNRWYDSTNGRWPSRDPIEERGGMNLYGFVGNNALRRYDFLGLDAADQQSDEAIQSFLQGSRTTTRTYGPNDPWTQELQNHQWMDTVRSEILATMTTYCIGRGSQTGVIGATFNRPYQLNRQSLATNISTLANDIFAGLNVTGSYHSMGSFNLSYTIKSIKCSDCSVDVDFVANDRLRLGSFTRVPGESFTFMDLAETLFFGQNPEAWQSMIPRNWDVNEPGRVFNTINLKWEWSENLQ